MSYQRIEKQFVLSDSSVNEYGFKLLTSGYMLAEFMKNPIGYYMHDKKDGVLLKWEDVQLDGDKVVGYPCINMSHPRAERTVTEINDGFLNAASVGHLKVIESELQDNPNGGDPIPVFTKWFNKECSLVDSPGNRAALKVGLYDADDQEINLADLTKDLITNNTMAQKTLPITAELLALLNLSDDSTAEAVVAGISGLKADKEAAEADHADADAKRAAAETNLADLNKKIAGEQVSGILDKALTEGRINKALKAKLEKQFAGNPTDLADLVNDMQPYISIADKLGKVAAGDVPQDLADMTFDQLDRSDMLGRVKTEYPSFYAKKFEEKFGKLPG